MKEKISSLLKRIPLLLTAITTAVMLFTPLQARASYDAWAGSIVDSMGSSNSGGTDTVPDGISYNKTGYLCYMLTPDGAPASSFAVALHSPGYPGDNGASWIVTSRKGGYTASRWSGVADWGLTPWANGGSPTHEPQIRQYFESTDSNGAQNAFRFVDKYFGEDMAHKFGNDEAILVIETIMKLSLSVTSGGGGDLTPYQVYMNQVNSVRKMETKQLIEMTGSQDVMDAFIIGNLNTDKLRNLVVRLLGEKFRNNPDSFQSSGGKYEVVAGPFVGTVPNLVKEKMSYSPEPKVLDSYLLKVAPMAERIQQGKAGEKAGFIPWTGSTSSRLSNQDVLNYGVAMMVISAKNGQSTADEPKIPTPHEPPKESEGAYIIIKNYRTKEGENKYIDDGCFKIENITSSITIENESPGYKVIEWKITNQFNGEIPSYPWNPPGGVQDSGKGPGTVKIKDPYKVLYVLLEKEEEEPPEPADYNYLISESTITRRVKMSEPDNQLSMPDILNHNFKWVLPAHKTTCSGHTWTKECDGSHTRPVKVSDGCPDNCTKDQIDPTHQHQGAQYDTQNYNCGQNCKTQTAYCSGWDWKNKDLKLSLHNINQQSSPNILAIKTSPKNWFYNPNTNISKLIQGFYRDNNTFDREAPSQQIYENKNWDYICVIHRGQDKLNLAEWINNGQGQYDPTEATINLQGVNNEVYQASNQSSGQRKQNGFYTDTFQVSIGRQEHGVEQTDNETIYGPTTPSSVPGQSPLGSTICPDDPRRATLTPLSFNVIVRVEVYKGLETTDKHDGFEDGHTSKPRNYDNVSGRMIKGSNISFIPYILMKYDTIDEAITDAPAYVMGEHTRDMSLLHYGEIAWNKSSNPNNLTLTSAQWSTHASATKWLADKNIQDKNSVLPGGATHSLSIKKDDRQTVTVTTYQSIIVGLGEKHVTNTTGGQIPDDLTIPTAQSEHTSFVASVVDALDQTVIQQYVNKNPDKDPEDGIAVNPSTSIDSLHGSSNRTASTESKYYFRNDGEGATAGQGDFDVRELGTDTRIYTYYTTVDGRIMSADTTANPGVFKSGEGTLAESASWTALIEPRLHIVAKLKAALEDHTGNDDTALTGTNWYNEAFDGISVIVQDTQLEVGFIDPTERTQVLDPKLIPDTLGSKSNGTTAIKDLFNNLKR